MGILPDRPLRVRAGYVLPSLLLILLGCLGGAGLIGVGLSLGISPYLAAWVCIGGALLLFGRMHLLQFLSVHRCALKSEEVEIELLAIEPIFREVRDPVGMRYWFLPHGTASHQKVDFWTAEGYSPLWSNPLKTHMLALVSSDAPRRPVVLRNDFYPFKVSIETQKLIHARIAKAERPNHIQSAVDLMAKTLGKLVSMVVVERTGLATLENDLHEWLKRMPACLRPYWPDMKDALPLLAGQDVASLRVYYSAADSFSEGGSINESSSLDEDMPGQPEWVNAITTVLRKAFPEPVKRAAALLRWYSVSRSPFTGYPAYEDLPAWILGSVPIHLVISAVAQAGGDEALLLGGARYFVSHTFLGKRHSPRHLPSELREQLMACCLRHRNPQELVLAQRAYG